MMKVVAFLAVLLSGCAMTPAHLRSLADSTVQVESDEGWGSGVVVGRDLVLTCAHVVVDHTDLVVHAIRGGARWTVAARLVRVDAAHDLALLSAPRLGLPTAHLAARDVGEFETVWGISSPLTHERTVTTAVVSTRDDAGTWRLTGPMMQGSSGGAVFDARGDLQCIFSALWGYGAKYSVMGRCIDRQTVQRFLGRL